jgi:hypothetical protein
MVILGDWKKIRDPDPEPQHWQKAIKKQKKLPYRHKCAYSEKNIFFSLLQYCPFQKPASTTF